MPDNQNMQPRTHSGVENDNIECQEDSPMLLSNNHSSSVDVQVNNNVQSFETDKMLSFGAKQIISLFVPVTLCMLFVVLVAATVDYYGHTDRYLIYTPFHTPNADLATLTWQTLANTMIFMSVIVVVTFFLFLLFKYHCYRFIHGWLIMTTVILLFMISFLFFTQVFRAMGLFVDYITVAFILWNFGVAGMMVIHWRGPLVLQQAYLIFVSAQIALVFLKYLPKWTCWVLLGALAIWDLVAVLCPKGPLRMLVEIAGERNQPLFPAMLYSTTAVYIVTTVTNGEKGSTNENPEPAHDSVELNQPTGSDQLTGAVPTEVSGAAESGYFNFSDVIHAQDNSGDHASSLQPADQLRRRNPEDVSLPQAHSMPRNNRSSSIDSAPLDRWQQVQADLQDREERGVKLGLGDFVFYSLLIGRAALDGDSITVVTCYVAILVGMCVTIVVLGLTQRALPALPVSIACGILFYFVTSVVISPFLEQTMVTRVMF